MAELSPGDQGFLRRLIELTQDGSWTTSHAVRPTLDARGNVLTVCRLVNAGLVERDRKWRIRAA